MRNYGKFRQRNAYRGPCEQGFTLVEILIAVFILGIVLSTVYASYTGTFRIIGETQEDAEKYGMARNALDRMVRDLQSAAIWRGTFAFVTNTYPLGDREFMRLTFRSAAHIGFGDQEASGGITVIDYNVEEGQEGEGYVLTRSDNLNRDPDKEDPVPGGYVLCNRIATLTYGFTDEAGKEYPSWDSSGQVEIQKNKAPASVLIRLSLLNPANPERPHLFMTRARIPFHRPEAP